MQTYTTTGLVNVIIETPCKSRNKYVYDEKLNMFKLKKVLPAGFNFPFDMGFIPNTLGDDKDPLDVLIFMDEPGYPGCVIECRIIGVIQIVQEEIEKIAICNDRYIAIPGVIKEYAHLQEITDFNKDKLEEITYFLKSYMKTEQKKITIVEISGSHIAHAMIQKAIK